MRTPTLHGWSTPNPTRIGFDVETPALLVDLDTMDRNLQAANQILDRSEIRLRAHIKTHRSSGLARRQLAAGADGVTCATVGEAETMAAAGIDDILIANEIATESKVERVASLAETTRIAVTVDHQDHVDALSRTAVRHGATIRVLVDVNVGLDRCGVDTADDARILAKHTAGQEGVRMVGLMGYEGRLRADDPQRAEKLIEARERLTSAYEAVTDAGIQVEEVSAGGTSTFLDLVDSPIVTEIQAGTYALMEPDLDGLGLPFECAAIIVATVVSQRPGELIVDAGRKTVGVEYGLPTPLSNHGHAESISEEHLVVSWGGTGPEIGDQVALRPTQIRTTFNLHDRAWLVRDGTLVGSEPVDARGRSQ